MGSSGRFLKDAVGTNVAVYSLCIVEDDAESASALEAMVRRSPFSDSLTISVFENRAELENRLAQGGRVDVLVTDINLGTD